MQLVAERDNIYEIGTHSEMGLKCVLLELERELLIAKEITANNTCLDFLVITDIYKGPVRSYKFFLRKILLKMCIR